MVELSKYRFLPHCIGYASQPADITGMIKKAISIMMRRYKAMTWQGITLWQGGQLYIFIDEYADLSITCKKAIPDILRLCQLGRAAGIHVIIATQRPTRDIITGAIKINLVTRIALHVPTAQDSRNIIGIKAAENLPLYGYGYLYTSIGIEKISIPYIQPADIADRIKSIYHRQHLPGKILRFIKHIKAAI